MKILSFLKAVPKIVRYGWRAYKWAMAMDAAGVRLLSPVFFAEARKRIEEFVLGLTKGQDEGVRAMFESDNAMLCGLGILMKSDAILAVYGAKGLTARINAEKALHEKDIAKSVTGFVAS
jgi:hypothetical protein